MMDETLRAVTDQLRQAIAERDAAQQRCMDLGAELAEWRHEATEEQLAAIAARVGGRDALQPEDLPQFFATPPIDVTGGVDPATYVEDLYDAPGAGDMKHSKSGKPLWCYWHIEASDEDDPACTAHLADGMCFVCPYCDYSDSQAQEYACVDARIVREGHLWAGGKAAVHPCDATTGKAGDAT